jgi:hypothetical protein
MCDYDYINLILRNEVVVDEKKIYPIIKRTINLGQFTNQNNTFEILKKKMTTCENLLFRISTI